MTTKKNESTPRLPEHRGKEYVDNTQNKYTGNVPGVIKEALNLRLYLAWIGSAFLLQRSEWKRMIYPLTLISQSEKERNDLRKEQFKDHIGLKKNALAGATKGLARKYSLSAVIGLMAEYLVFQNMGENLFGFSFYGSIVFGLVVLVITPAVIITIKPFINNWIRKNNYFLPSKIKKYLFLYCVLILVLLITSGMANYFDKEYVRLQSKIQSTTREIHDFEEKNMDTKILQERREVLKTELEELDTPLARGLKIVAYAMIGFICVIGSALASIYAEETKRIVDVNQELLEVQQELSKTRAKIKHLNKTHPEVKRAHLEVVRMFGQKDLLEKLMTPNQCTSLRIESAPKK